MSTFRNAVAVLGVAFLLAGCATPKTFVKTLEPTWASIEVRSDIPYEKA